MKILAIYYSIGVLHFLGSMATDPDEYREIVKYMKQNDSIEVWAALFVVLIFTPIIWPQILFYQIFDKEVE